VQLIVLFRGMKSDDSHSPRLPKIRYYNKLVLTSSPAIDSPGDNNDER
jgi:hypothetical protein